MIIDLTVTGEKQKSFNFLLQPAEIDLGGEAVKLNEALKIEGELKKGIIQTNTKGEIFADVELECSRCLQPIQRNLEIQFEAAFVTPENYTQAREAEIGSEDLEISIFEGDKIDLRELAREQLLLALPAQIFCKEDCKGFCQKCGANQNLIDCNCEENELDPRWAKLKELK